jgi:cytoskeletal protein RodZ
MKHSIIIKIITSTLVIAGIIVTIPLVVQAKDAIDPSTPTDSTNGSSGKKSPTVPIIKKDDNSTGGTQTESQKPGDISSKSGEKTDTIREKLADLKLKSCTERQANVNTIMTRVVDRSKAQVDRITTVADKAKAFYIKQGNILDTYDTLVADVTAKQALAEAAVATLTSQSSFSCTSDGPKSDIAQFNTDRVAKKAAIDAYRTAVKALIAGIKSVQPTTTGSTN